MSHWLTPGRRDLQQLRVDGEADDVVAAHGLQQRQRGLAAIVAVAAHQDRDVRPVLADAADHVTQDLRHFLARWPLAGPQQRQHGLAREAVEDVDRLEAGAVVVRVEQRQFLLAVHGIVGVVDVEHDAQQAVARSSGSRDRSGRARCAPAHASRRGSPAATASAGSSGRRRSPARGRQRSSTRDRCAAHRRRRSPRSRRRSSTSAPSPSRRSCGGRG